VSEEIDDEEELSSEIVEADRIDKECDNFCRWYGEYCKHPANLVGSENSSMSSGLGLVMKYKIALVPTTTPTWAARSMILLSYWAQKWLFPGRYTNGAVRSEVLSSALYYRLNLIRRCLRRLQLSLQS